MCRYENDTKKITTSGQENRANALTNCFKYNYPFVSGASSSFFFFCYRFVFRFSRSEKISLFFFCEIFTIHPCWRLRVRYACAPVSEKWNNESFSSTRIETEVGTNKSLKRKCDKKNQQRQNSVQSPERIWITFWPTIIMTVFNADNSDNYLLHFTEMTIVPPFHLISLWERERTQPTFVRHLDIFISTSDQREGAINADKWPKLIK